jgi:hypothetical protein
MSLEVQNRELQLFFNLKSKATKDAKNARKRKNDILFQILSLDPLTLETFSHSF